MINRKEQIICSEHSFRKNVTSFVFCFFFSGTLPIDGLQLKQESSIYIANSGNNTDSDVFESQQMIREEPKVEPNFQNQTQTQPEEGMRYEQPVERIDSSSPDSYEQAPRQIPTRNAKRGKAAPDIREVVPDGKSLPQNFDNMKKKVKAKKKGRKPVEEEMPALAPQIVPHAQTTRRSDPQEESLSQLVNELEYGTLTKSIKLLRNLVNNYPEDSDYKKLLDMSLALQDADTWYSYQRHTPSPSLSQGDEPEKKAEPKPLPQLQASSENPRVNELKRSSWLLIKNSYHRNK